MRKQHREKAAVAARKLADLLDETGVFTRKSVYHALVAAAFNHLREVLLAEAADEILSDSAKPSRPGSV